MQFKNVEITHVGNIRKNNEDYYVYTSIDTNHHLFVVADGMGGLQAGEVASRSACEAIASYFLMEKIESIYYALKNSIEIANNIVYNYGKSKNLKSIGTTAVVFYIEDKNAFYAHIGDSRLYLYENEKLKQLTKDHSYVQYLIDNNQITEQEAKTHPKRNMITRAIGIELNVNPTVFEKSIELKNGQIYLLCTDGLFNSIDKETIEKILSEKIDIKLKANNILQEALKLGGSDNITFILIEIQD